MTKRLLLGLVLSAVLLLPLESQAATMIGPFSFSKTAFDFYYTQGAGLPTIQDLTFDNVTNNNVTYTISVPNQPKWLNTSYNTEPLVSSPGSPTGLGAMASPEGLNPGTYNTVIYLSGSFPASPIAIPVTLRVQAPGTPLPANTVHPEGTNVKASDGTVYRIMGGARYPYTSAGAFLSYGYNNWADVQVANEADMALSIPTCTPTEGATPRPCYIAPRDGSIINDQGTIYIISDGYRQGFASSQAFLGLGYSFASALPGDTSFLITLAPINSSAMAHPSGTVVNASGTICVIESPFKSSGRSGRKCFATLTDMNSWGIRNYEILPANSYDAQLPITGTIAARTAISLMNP